MSSSSDEGVRCCWMRGGTSKGGFFVAEDLPQDISARNAFLLSAMGSPDPLQIDGMGGADPLTSKVAIVSKSDRPDTDVDYLFLQVFVDQAIVTDSQNCGNLLAAVGQFAVERGLVEAQDGSTAVRIALLNTGKDAIATIETPGRVVRYDGQARIDGVPGTAAPVRLSFCDVAGSSCGALLPTGNPSDRICGIDATLIDNGMPCIIIRAADVGVTGNEDRATLEADHTLKGRIEKIRLAAGPLMNLGDVAELSVPKVVLVSPARSGGAINTRCFIPHRVHAGIGVLAAVTVATACLIEGSSAYALAKTDSEASLALEIEHPTGSMQCALELGEDGSIIRAGIVRTARKLFDGRIFASQNAVSPAHIDKVG